MTMSYLRRASERTNERRSESGRPHTPASVIGKSGGGGGSLKDNSSRSGMRQPPVTIPAWLAVDVARFALKKCGQGGGFGTFNNTHTQARAGGGVSPST